MERSDLEDPKCQKLLERATHSYNEGNYVKALELIEDLSLFTASDNASVNFIQGTTFNDLVEETENTDVKFAYLLGSVECFSKSIELSTLAASSLFNLSQQLGSVFYYKESLAMAKQAFSILHLGERALEDEEDLKYIIKNSESKIAESKTHVGSSVEIFKQKVRESKGNEDTSKSDSDLVQGLKSYWAGLKVEEKRNFMKVSIADLSGYVFGLYGTQGQDALEQVLTSAREDRKWRFWMCRTCSKKFSTPEECKNHLVQQHAPEFEPPSSKVLAQRISKVWARKISVGDWEPVDAVAAVEMIKNRLKDVKAFAYENGWSKDWPLASDEERSKLLKEIQLLLVSLCNHKILSCSIRDWVMHIVVKHLEELEVSKHTLTDCRLVETPQSISFLECRELNQIMDYLKDIKCEMDDGTDMVCRAVDNFYNGARVKEKIDFDPLFSFLLMDKRLLQSKIARFDDEGTINIFDPNVHYTKVHAKGDDILSWLTDYSSEDERFQFPTPIRAHNFDIWLAVLRAAQFMCRTLHIKYSKKVDVLHYDAFIIAAKDVCTTVDEDRRNIPKNQWDTYASFMCDECENLSTTDAKDSLTKLLLSAVRDVLEGAPYPTFDIRDSEESLNVIRECKNVSDDIVLKSIDLLKLAVTNKVPIIDSEILLIENSRISLLNDLTRLSVFDYRSYILRPLKQLLLDWITCMSYKAKLAAIEADLLLKEENKSLSKKKKNKCNKVEGDGIVDMDAKANLAAAQANLLSEKKQEKEKMSGKKKKKHRNNKRTSTSMSSLLDQNLNHESSLNLELRVTSPSLETAKEDPMVQEDTLSSERGRLDISFNIDNQEEAAKDVQNMPREDSLSKHMEPAHGAAAAICNSALDMTLKALCKIKVLKEYLVHNRHQFPDTLEEQIPSALQSFFTAFVSKQIKEEGLHSYLLGNLLASLKELNFMSSDAAELFVAILEFWPCWKSPQIENLVTHLFTLEISEKMSCTKCRRHTNYPEHSSNGVVMAADSIRDLKCAFGNIKFEDILKVIGLEDRMLCNIKSGGCGKTNFVHHIISRCPPIFTIVLEWEKNETENEITETTRALDWEIDISRLYESLEPNIKYRLVSMVGCAEEKEYICMAYKKNRWVSFRHGALAKEDVGNWKSLVRFCGEKKIRPEILFYEAARSMG